MKTMPRNKSCHARRIQTTRVSIYSIIVLLEEHREPDTLHCHIAIHIVLARLGRREAYQCANPPHLVLAHTSLL